MLKTSDGRNFNVTGVLELFKNIKRKNVSYKNVLPKLLEELQTTGGFVVKPGNYSDPALLVVSQTGLSFDTHKDAIKFVKKLSRVMQVSYINIVEDIISRDMELAYMQNGCDEEKILHFIEVAHNRAVIEFAAEGVHHKFLHRAASSIDFLHVTVGLKRINPEKNVGAFSLVPARTPLCVIRDYLMDNPRFTMDLLSNFATEDFTSKQARLFLEHQYIVSAFTDSERPIYIKQLDLSSVKTTDDITQALVLPFNPFAGMGSKDYPTIHKVIKLFSRLFSNHFIESIRVELVKIDGKYTVVPVHGNSSDISFEGKKRGRISKNPPISDIAKQAESSRDSVIVDATKVHADILKDVSKVNASSLYGESSSKKAHDARMKTDNVVISRLKDLEEQPKDDSFNMRIDVAVDKDAWNENENDALVKAIQEKNYSEVSIPGEL